MHKLDMRICLKDRLEPRKQASVQFDGYQASTSLGQDSRQCAPAGAYLDNQVVSRDRCLLDQTRCERTTFQEVLR